MSATVVPVAHPSLLGFQLGEEFWIFAAQGFQPSTFLLFKRQGFAGDPSIFSFSTELDWLLEELDDGQVLDLYRLSGREIETHWLFGSTQNDLRELIMSGELRAFKLDEQTARRMSNRNDTIFSDATGYEATESSPVNALRAQLADKFAKDLEEFWIGKDKADKLHWDKNAIHRELVEAVDSGAEVVDFAYDTIVGILDLLIFAIEVTAEVVVARAQVKMLAQRAFANYLKGNQEAARKDLEAIGIKVDGWMKSAETVAAKIQQGLDLFNLMMNDPMTRQLLTDYLDARYESLPFRDSRTVPTRLVLEVGVEVLLALASGGGGTLAKVSAKAGKAFSAGAVKAAKLSRIGPFTLEMIDLMCDMARLMRKAEMKEVEAPKPKVIPNENKRKESRDKDENPDLPPVMPKHHVQCFKAGDKIPSTKYSEYDRQLRGQQDGINEMTVEEYLDGRKKYQEMGRKGGSAQRKARKAYRNERQAVIEQELEEEGVFGDEAIKIASERVAEEMSTLAALHNPDMIAGGKDVVTEMGDMSVNSSIGAQWNNPKGASRVELLDKAAESAMKKTGRDTKMNVDLHRC